jgi:hypothetical protein
MCVPLQHVSGSVKMPYAAASSTGAATATSPATFLLAVFTAFRFNALGFALTGFLPR